MVPYRADPLLLKDPADEVSCHLLTLPSQHESPVLCQQGDKHGKDTSLKFILNHLSS